MSLKSNFPKITRHADQRAELHVRKAILDIQAGAMVRSRERSGDMRRGWHAEMIDSHSGFVNNEVEHTIFNEEGTKNEDDSVRMKAQPMLAPSVEEARPGFERGIQGLYGS